MSLGNDFHELVELLTAEHERVLGLQRDLVSEVSYLREKVVTTRQTSNVYEAQGSVYDVPDHAGAASVSLASAPHHDIKDRRGSDASLLSNSSEASAMSTAYQPVPDTERTVNCIESDKSSTNRRMEQAASKLRVKSSAVGDSESGETPLESTEENGSSRCVMNEPVPDERHEIGAVDLLRMSAIEPDSMIPVNSKVSMNSEWQAEESKMTKHFSKSATAGRSNKPRFVLRYAWVHDAPNEIHRRAATQVRPFQWPGNYMQSNSTMTTLSKTSSRCGLFILAPSSKVRLAWDLVGLLALIYDMVRVPLQAFPMQRTAFDHTMDWVARIVWTTDMPASIFVGFYRKGELIMDFPAIVKHYICTWFLLDAGLIASDWLNFYLEDEKGSYIKMIRWARFVRLLRLVRLFKLQRILQGFEDLVDTEVLSIYLRMVKPLVFIACLNHVLACAWYAIGAMDDSQRHWVEVHVEDGKPESKVPYLYLTSLHWSLSQFTVGNMDVHPHNTTERLFTVAVMMLGLSSFSSLLGGISNAVSQLRELKTDETRQLWVLRRYLKDYGISHKLSVRIFKYCDYAWNERRKRVQEEDVNIIQLLTHQLRDELNCEIQLPHLERHPLFEKMARLRSSTMDKICSKALANHHLACSDYVYQAGEPCSRMVFLTDGELLYTQLQDQELDGRSSSSLEEKFLINIQEGMWTCEATLWTPWVQMGDLRALRECRLVCLEAQNFCELMFQMQTLAWQLAKSYAAKFIKLMNQVDQLTDILQAEFHPNVVLGELVQQLTAEASSSEEWMLRALNDDGRHRGKRYSLFSHISPSHAASMDWRSYH